MPSSRVRGASRCRSPSRAGRVLAAVVAGFLALPWTDPALATCTVTQIAELPVQRDRGRPVTAGLINGQPVRLLIDTGAEFSFLDLAAAHRLNLTLDSADGLHVFGVGGVARVFSTLVNQLQIGQFTDARLRIAVVGGKPRDRRPRQRPDFFLGEDFFARFDTELDLAHDLIRLSRADDCSDAQRITGSADFSVAQLVDAQLLNPRVDTVVQVNGRSFRARIDSGAATSFITASAARRAGPFAPPAIAEPGSHAVGVGGTPVAVHSAQFATLSIGDDETIQNVRLNVADLFGRDTVMKTGSHIAQPADELPEILLGCDFLRAHRVVVLFAQRRLLLAYLGGPVFQVRAPGSGPLR